MTMCAICEGSPMTGACPQCGREPAQPPAATHLSMANLTGWEAGIVYAAGWLASAHGEDSLAEELLASADLTTAAKCRKAGADKYDIKNCRRPFSYIAQRKRNRAALALAVTE